MDKLKQIFRTLLDYGTVVLIAVGVGFLIKFYICGFAYVDGISMSPTFHNTQIVLIDKISPHFSDYKQGDIVVFNSHDESNDLYVKRVIGVPGDHVVIKDNKVYVNDEELNEYYLPEGTPTEGKIDLVVSKEHYFVLGDNRLKSKDSRYIGPIDRKDITGRVANNALHSNGQGPLKIVVITFVGIVIIGIYLKKNHTKIAKH